MARVRLCVCGSWFVGSREGAGQAAHQRAPGQCLHFKCRAGAPARVRVWRCEGRPPLPHQPPLCVCVWRNLPYLTCPAPLGLATALARRRLCTAATRRTSINNAPASGEHLIKISQRSCHWHCPLGHHPRRRDAILGAAADGAAGTDSVVAGRGVGRRRMARRGSRKTPNTSEPEPSIVPGTKTCICRQRAHARAHARARQRRVLRRGEVSSRTGHT